MFDQKLSTPVYRDIQTGAAVAAILDAVGWSTSARQIDQGANVLPFWWAEDVTVLQALDQLLISEGPYARIYVSSSGDFCFHDRNHRYTSTASAERQATLSNSTEPKYSMPLEYDIGWRNVVNDVTIRVQPRTVTANHEIVWTYDDRIWINASTFQEVAASALFAFTSAITPVEDTDFTETKGTPVTVSLDRTSGQTVTIRFTNTSTSAPAQIKEGLQLRARPINRDDPFDIHAESTGSKDDYGVRSYQFNAQWVNEPNAVALGQVVLERYKQPTPQMVIRVHNATTGRIDQQLNREIGDRVLVKNTANGMQTACTVDRVRHEIGQAGKSWDTYFTMTKIPNYTVGTTQAFILDSTDQGRLNQDYLAL